MIIKFKEWHKFNPRKDIKHPAWFAFSNNFFSDPKIFELSIEEVLTFIFLLCEASRNNKNGEVFVSTVHYRLQSRMPERVLNRTLVKLQELQIIEQPRVRGLYASVRDPNTTDRQTDRQYRQTVVCSEPSSKPLEPETLPVMKEFESIKEILLSRKVKIEAQRSWADAFPDTDWIIQKIRQAVAWEIANPLNKKKNFTRYIQLWLSRDWDKRPAVNKPISSFKAEQATNPLYLKTGGPELPDGDDIAHGPKVDEIRRSISMALGVVIPRGEE